MSRATLHLAMLGVLAALGSIAIQLIVPALPLIASGLRTGIDDAQLIVGLYLAALAVGQLCWGPVVDRSRRRPMLSISGTLFLVATIGCALADSFPLLLACRVIQGFAAAGTLAACRLMASDNRSDDSRAGALAVMSSVVLISPAVSPSIGGLLAETLGWRGAFWVLGGFAAVTMLVAMRVLPETRSPAQATPHGFWQGYRHVARQPRFLRLVAANALLTSSFYLFLGTVPFVLATHGFSPAQSGFALSLVATGLLAGTLLVPLVERRGGLALRRASQAILWLTVVALAVLTTVLPDALPLVGAMILLGIGSGLTSPSLLAEAIALGRQWAGTASSVFGALQMMTAAAVSSIVVQFHPSIGMTMLLIASFVAASALLRPRAGSVDP